SFFSPSGRRGSPAAAPIAATGPGEGRSAPGCAPPCRSGDVAVRRALPLPLTLRVHPGQGVGRPPVGRPAAPGRRGHATPAPSSVVAACLNPPPARRRARVGRPAPPLPLPSLPV